VKGTNPQPAWRLQSSLCSCVIEATLFHSEWKSNLLLRPLATLGTAWSVSECRLSNCGALLTRLLLWVGGAGLDVLRLPGEHGLDDNAISRAHRAPVWFLVFILVVVVDLPLFIGPDACADASGISPAVGNFVGLFLVRCNVIQMHG
jgi:hypothetical protein